MLKTDQNRLTVRPESAEALKALLQSHYKDDSAIFCGAPADVASGRQSELFVDFSLLDKVREHVVSDMVIAVETGISIIELNKLLAEKGQFFPVDTADPSLLLIDLINCGDAGYLEQAFGYMRSLVLGVDLAHGAGKCAKLGGRVVKNVTGFDLTKLIVGGRGVFGLPHLAHLRLFALPPVQTNFVVGKKSVADLLLMAIKLSSSGLPLTALEILEIQDGGSSAHVLIAQVRGSRELVDDISKQLKPYLGGAVAQLSADELAAQYPAMQKIDATGLELALSRSSASSLIDQLSTLAPTRRGYLRYRPGCGRLFLDCPNVDTIDNALNLVREKLSGARTKTGSNALADFEPPIISRHSGRYQFSSQSSAGAERDGAFAELVGRLRETLDPLSCFGRGVTFHGR